jgi:hypothetical protein
MARCAFCGWEGKLSGEHVWSAWIANLLAPHATGFNFHHHNTETSKTYRWQKATMDEKANVVCKTCNEGWMSDIEASARTTLSHIIRDGAPVSLLPRGITALARFAFKCAVVSNHMSPDGGGPFFSSFIRRRFKESLEIPSGVEMWVGAFQGFYKYGGLFNSRYVKSDADATHDLGFYVFTFAAGHLAFQVVAKKWTQLHHAARTLPSVHFESIWDQAAIRFWPNQHGLPASWPPTHYLDSDTIQDFTARLSGRVNLGFSVARGLNT